MDELNYMPLRVVNGATVYLKDVAQVRDGYSVQTSIVRTNGSRGALLTVLRSGKASTLAVVNNVKAALPKILAGLPPALKVQAALRPIDLRARRHQRRGARGRDRGHASPA